MFTATAERPLAATITGSLPRPGWFKQNLAGRTFNTAFAGDAEYREQYSDAVAALISDQERAGLDILTDGEMRFDMDIGGRSWFGYLFDRLDGLQAMPGTEGGDKLSRSGSLGRADTPGDIMNEFAQTKLPPVISGPVHADRLQYEVIWKIAQRLTDRPVKMGSCSAQMLDKHMGNCFYKDRSESVMALSTVLNEEYHRLADAGCTVIQIEEPCLHNVGAASEIPLEVYVEAFNREVRGLRTKTELWCHTCWGNPFAQRIGADSSYRPILAYLDRLDVDVITVEATENQGSELAEIVAALSQNKKLCVGVINHRSLQVETPEGVATLIRKALQHIAPERLLLSSDCGFGRQGITRTHAYYKMVAMVRGANIVRRELGLAEVNVPATDKRFALP